jgi:hypothetical protein
VIFVIFEFFIKFYLNYLKIDEHLSLQQISKKNNNFINNLPTINKNP